MRCSVFSSFPVPNRTVADYCMVSIEYAEPATKTGSKMAKEQGRNREKMVKYVFNAKTSMPRVNG